ncbi:MAG: rRNA maturation RNase YbeY [Segniliparus sp.]|uniref:rRNA maturation RNase YbeY n=1 Tax=Segniliparus sp. TaxID=2804064 RepID=UPI003F419FFA
MSVELANESGAAAPEGMLIHVAQFALDQMRVNPAAELSMLLVDTTTMTHLHQQWMNLPGPTDVLSFPMDDAEPDGRPDAVEVAQTLLGDIVLCPEVAAEQAQTAGHSTEHELIVLTVHGVLHILGYDHAEPEEEAEMFALQGKLVERWYANVKAQAKAEALGKRDAKLLRSVGLEAEGDG